MDTLGCGFEALGYSACTKMLGPIVQGTVVPNGAKVPGTQFQLDPVKAAFDIGTMIGLDFTTLGCGRKWGNPRQLADSLPRPTACAQRRREWQGAVGGQRRADRNDKHTRPGLHRVANSLKGGSTTSSGQGRVDGGVEQMLGRAREILNAGVWLGSMGNRSNLSPFAQYWLAQELGRRRRDITCGAAGVDREDGRDGLSVGTVRQDVGLL